MYNKSLQIRHKSYRQFYFKVKFLSYFCVIITNAIHDNMSEVELFLIKDGENCTIYTLQFLNDIESEFEKFIAKFRDDAEYSEDYARIATFVTRIARNGALERYFRNEGKISDSVVALPVTSSKLRLYCLRLSDKILVLGNGGVKNTRRYEDDPVLNGYVMTLQNFEKLLRQEAANGNVNITESTIETDNIFDL